MSVSLFILGALVGGLVVARAAQWLSKRRAGMPRFITEVVKPNGKILVVDKPKHHVNDFRGHVNGLAGPKADRFLSYSGIENANSVEPGCWYILKAIRDLGDKKTTYRLEPDHEAICAPKVTYVKPTFNPREYDQFELTGASPSIDGVGSPEGLLDLTRESDDTSLLDGVDQRGISIEDDALDVTDVLPQHRRVTMTELGPKPV